MSKKTSEQYWENNQKCLITLSTTNIEKVDKIGRKYNLSRSAVINIFLSQLTGNEDLEWKGKVDK